ncbi:hypothetical protein ACB264_17645 [Klebsiella pneumoniae]
MHVCGAELAATLAPGTDGDQSTACTPDRPCTRSFSSLP